MNQTRPGNTAAIERTTGRPWRDWLELLERAGAKGLTHPEIARLAREAMPSGLKNPDWWAQGVAIAFEQHVGLRVPGQSVSGEFRVGASRNVARGRDEAVEQWARLIAASGDQLGHAVTDLRRSRTEKRTFWRATLTDAGKVEFAAAVKSDDRSLCSIQHTGLPGAEAVEVWRAHWKTRLAEL